MKKRIPLILVASSVLLVVASTAVAATARMKEPTTEPQTIYRTGRDVEWNSPHLKDHEMKLTHMEYHQLQKQRHEDFHKKYDAFMDRPFFFEGMHRRFHESLNMAHRAFHRRNMLAP